MLIYWSFIVLFATFTTVVTSLPNLYLLQNEESEHTYCAIINEIESTAVALLKNNQPIEGSEIFLNSDVGRFNWEISNDRKCEEKFINNNIKNKKVWEYDRSDNYDLRPILDRRWEGLSTVETGKINFVNIHNFTGPENFTVMLSIKINFNAYIYLCDGLNPSDSNCYWFVLGGWEGKYSIIRKCEKDMIKNVEGNFLPENSTCGKHPKHESEPLMHHHTENITSLTAWTDFVLTKNNSTYSIKKKSVDKDIVRYDDKDHSQITVKHLLVASPRDNPGKWKVDSNGVEYVTGGLSKIQSWGNNEVKRLSFSVVHLPKGSAIIHLCDKEDTHNSACYRITLTDENYGNVCFFNLYQKECKQVHVSKGKIIISSWTHFELAVNGSNYKIFDYNGTFLEFNDKRIKPNFVLFGSVQEAYWKIHSYGLFTGNTSGDTNIDLIRGKKGQRICFAVFANTCDNCNLTLELRDKQDRTLAIGRPSKAGTWEEVKLWIILKDDAHVKLKISLEIIANGRAFIGDIRDCSKNLRVLKVGYHKANNMDKVWCKALKFPSINIKNNENILAVPAVNTSIIDIVWIRGKENCSRSEINKTRIENMLNCTINDTNITTSMSQEICFVTFQKNSSKNTCTVYDESIFAKIMNIDDTSNHIIWILITFAILCCCIGATVYLYKKDKVTHRTAWTYIIPRTYSFITTELFRSNRVRRDATLLELSDCNYLTFSCLVKTENFNTYIEIALREGELLTQYNMIEGLKSQPHMVGLMKENVRMNRYKNIIAYDATRVMLESTYSNINDDYINANYIEGFNRQKAFIASQGPLPTTVNDFWRMIWQGNIKCVVMLSKVIENGRKKCEKYWPELNDTFNCCAFKITCTRSNSINDDTTLRTLKVVFNSTEREVTQLHYEGWSDYSVPESPVGLVNVLNLLKVFESDDTPIVVHCSAGVGRSGSLILCDIALKMAEATKTVDVFNTLYELRGQRTKMVHNFAQYVYVHKVIATVLGNNKN